MEKKWIKRNAIEEALMDDTFKVVVDGVITEVPALRTLDNIIGKAGVFCWESELWEYNPEDKMYHSDKKGLEWLLDEIDLWQYHVIDQSIAEWEKWRADPEGYGFYVYGYSNPVEAGPHYLKEAFPDMKFITVQERARYKGRNGHRWYEQNLMLKEDLERLIAELKAGNKEAAEYLKRVFVFFIKPDDEESIQNTISDLIDSLEGNPKTNTLKLEPSELDPFGMLDNVIGLIKGDNGEETVVSLEDQMKIEMTKIGNEDMTHEEAIQDMNEQYFAGLGTEDDDLIFSGVNVDFKEENKGVLLMKEAREKASKNNEQKAEKGKKAGEEVAEAKRKQLAGQINTDNKKRVTIKINEDLKEKTYSFYNTDYFSVAAEGLILDYIREGKPSLTKYIGKYDIVKKKKKEDKNVIKIGENLIAVMENMYPDSAFSDILNALVIKKLTEKGEEVF